jgi:hypothetical protein
VQSDPNQNDLLCPFHSPCAAIDTTDVDPPNNEKLHPPAPDRPRGPDPLSIHIYLDAKRENASVDDIQELIKNAIRRMQVSETPPEERSDPPHFGGKR